MKSPRTPTVEECKLVLKCAKREGPTSAALIVLLWRGGLRTIEAQRARFEHIEKRNGGYALHIPLGKGNKRRTVGLSPQDFRYLKQRKKGPILETRTGKPWTTSMMRKVVKRLVQTANLPILFSPHDFRHAFAQQLLSESGQSQYVQKQLGHSTIKTTEIYLESIGADPSVEFCMGREW